MSDATLGLNAWTGRNTATIAAATWDEIGLVQDDSLDLDKAMAEITSRLSGGWKEEVGTVKEVAISLTVLYKPDDPDYLAFQDSWLNNTQLILGLFDSDVTDTGTHRGFHAAMEVKKISKPRKLKEAVVVTVDLVIQLEETTNAAPRFENITVA